MRVGLLTTSYPRYESDYRGVFVARLVESLERAGVVVDIVEPQGYDALKRGSGLIGNLRSSWAARLEFPLYCLHFLLLAIASGRRCDVLHANWSLAGAFAVIAGRLTRRKILLTERSSLLIDTSNALLNRFTGWVMRHSDGLVTISETARRRLSVKLPHLAVTVIPNGVDAALFVPPRDDRARRELGLDESSSHVLAVGRITPAKGLTVLVDAVARLSQGGVGVHAWIVGDGEAHGALERYVSENGLDGRVTLLGRKAPGDVARWMQAADVFVSCSEGESGGNVILEAMACGLPVVATPVGWAGDYVRDGENGFVFAVGDADGLVDKLSRVLTGGSRKILGERARQTIVEAGLTWEATARRYIDEYERLLGAGR